MNTIGRFDVEMFGQVAIALAALYTFLSPIIGRLQGRRAELAGDKRVDFDKMLTAAYRIIEERERAEKRCWEEKDGLQKELDSLRRLVHQQNETLTVWAMEMGKEPPKLDENGDPR
jgi:hypothetical protein